MKRAGIKIGVDVRELQEGALTGIGRWLLNFLKAAPLYRPQWQFILFANQHIFIEEIKADFRQVTIPEGLTFCWDQIKLPRAIKKERIDLFVSPYYKAPLFCPCKLVMIIHDLAPFLPSFPREIGNPLWLKLQKVLSNLMAKRADLVITVSNNSKNDILRLFRIAPEKIKVVYNGVEEKFSPLKDKGIPEIARKKYSIPGDYILYVGNLKPHKNISGIIKAYTMLSEDLKNKYQLVIVGKKDRNFLSIFSLCRELTVSNRVIFVDFAQGEDLLSLYRAATVFVFPSFYEGFGLPVLEAMACGVAVVTSSVASLPEVAGDAAKLVNPYSIEEISQALKDLLINPYLREELVNKGLVQARYFSLDKMAKDVFSAIEELL